MRKFAILAVLFLMFAACEDTNDDKPCYGMIFSDALPVQVWQGDCQTFNEKKHAGFFNKCFFAPLLCSIPVKFQFTEVFDANYSLTAFHGNGGAEISTIPFTQEGVNLLPNLEFQNENFLLNINPWGSYPGSNSDTAQSWVWASDGDGIASANSTGTGTGIPKESTRYLAAPRQGGGLWPAGEYLISWRVRNASTYGGSGGDGLGLTVWGMSSATDQTVLTVSGASGSIPRDNAFHTEMVIVTLDQPYLYIAFKLSRQGGGGTFAIKADFDFITIDSAPAVYERYLYTAEYDLTTAPGFSCGDRIRFEIHEDDASPTLVGHTDDLQTTDDPDLLTTIEYSNPSWYNGLDYDTDPAPFTLVVPALFVKDREIREVEVLELSSKTVQTSSIIKTQTYLETDYMPGYMHAKLLYALSHKSVIINGVPWVLEEDYSRTDTDRRSLLQKATAWLTKQESVVRNV